MGEAVCVVPVSPVRSQSSHKSEMVSQLLFGDVVTVLENADDWKRVSVQFDGYEGWCMAAHLIALTGQQKTGAPVFTGEWINTMFVNNIAMHLPMGCEISHFLNGAVWPGKNAFRYAGKFLSLREYQSFEEQIVYLTKFFVNTPYLWGGRSVFGIDCSGFTQLVFRMAGKRILRDAWQQEGQGIAVESGNAHVGDLAFFSNESGKVVHVGILLEKEQIIHAAGKVRIDRLTAEGIINVDTGVKTHSLSGIRRYS